MSKELKTKGLELTDEELEGAAGGMTLFSEDDVNDNVATCNHECPYESALKRPCDTCEFGKGINTAANFS
ncbi:hypothetical protein GH810_07775 [Acetobacterium paludosum]|uniref:Uncharacterized protein n=1 Tax=Acetobacterium paludosum TaxID=52693 RepID=A0A923HVX4_9FIRM|nr:hypothetical protein [Acetobacterium paludosum]MBC3888205.1 hypothetical protein [Acetobacterium paludosum]